MNYSFNLAGGILPVIKDFNIQKNTEVKSGKVVFIDENGIVNTEKRGTLLGVCGEDHSGKCDILNARANGNWVRVDITKDAVYSMDCPVFEAVSEGSETTFICAKAQADAKVKGALVLIEKGADSTNSDYIGKERKIVSASVNGDNTVITLEEGSKTFAGDKYAFVPMAGFKGYVNETDNGFCAVKKADAPQMTVVCTDCNTLKVMCTLDGKLFD